MDLVYHLKFKTDMAHLVVYFSSLSQSFAYATFMIDKPACLVNSWSNVSYIACMSVKYNRTVLTLPPAAVLGIVVLVTMTQYV